MTVVKFGKYQKTKSNDYNFTHMEKVFESMY